ncbi:hypothetical protein [uncultured Dokdonia sp.]|uniref:hypothetical protein n=1 Tax=Dokdonia sp. R78006 TaxID=3093866 RepID=UPI002601861F|nr:hypothetical protein [uncultured Dokdonia sp.]
MIYISEITINSDIDSGEVLAALRLEKVNHQVFFNCDFPLNKLKEEDVWNAILIGFLPIAFENSWNLKLNGPLDEKLLHSIKSELLPIMKMAYKTNFIPKIQCTATYKYNGQVEGEAATGLSCGVDSFATIKSKRSHLRYVSFFNVGSHGPHKTNKSLVIANHRRENVLNAAKKIKLPLLTINSNLSDFTNQKFQDNHAFLQLACAHLLSGYCDTYYYSSGQHNDYLDKHILDFIYINNFLVDKLSTSRLEVKSTLTNLTRAERTKSISDFKISYNHLDVCTDSYSAFRNQAINCSKCDKCMRTQLTLDIQKKYYLYKNVFDEDIYRDHINLFLAKLMITQKVDVLNAELYRLSIVDGLYTSDVYKKYLYLRWLYFKKTAKKLFKKRQ